MQGHLTFLNFLYSCIANALTSVSRKLILKFFNAWEYLDAESELIPYGNLGNFLKHKIFKICILKLSKMK